MVRYHQFDDDPDNQRHWFTIPNNEETFWDIVAWCEAEFGRPLPPVSGVRWSHDSYRTVFFTDPVDATAVRLRWC